MSSNDFPEKDQKGQENPVDFSDLGPLFDPDQEKEIPASDEDVSASDEEISASAGELSASAEETQESVSFQPQNSVDFSDLGPLFSQEEPPVLAGEAARVLKKLQEEMNISQEDPEEELEFIPQEEDSDLAEEPFLPEALYKETSPEESLAEESFEEEVPEVNAPQKEEPEEIHKSDDISSADSEAGPSDISEPSQEPAKKEELSSEESSESAALPQENAEPASEEKKVSAQEAAPRYSGRKGRPKRKKGEGLLGIPNLLVTVVWIAITVFIGVTLGRMAWACAADVLAFGRQDKPVTITVYEADTIEDITKKLHEGGLIKYPGLFKFYASLAVDEGEIHPGIWDLNTRYDYHALVNMMSPSSSREVIELMIPEGYSCRQIFALMEENKICTSLDLGAYAASGELDDYWFLDGVPRGDMYCLEGYLFPDTYQFYKNDSPRNVLTKMLNNFESRFDETMAAKIDSLNAHLTDLMIKGGHSEKFIAENQMTVQDVINVASLIEKETSSTEEGYVIASVIYNRLFNWPDNVPYLNIDATIVYALGGKNKLTQEDLKVNSPYNTYTHTGLTPGPIANPGLASIRAALDPADSNYYYYVLDPALGSHRFSTTYDEHKANIASIGG